MKRKMIYWTCVLFCAFIPLITDAQIMDIGDCYFYIESGEAFSLSKISFYKFEGNFIYAEGYSSNIQNLLISDPNACYKLPYKYGHYNHCYTYRGIYNTQESTNKYEVYTFQQREGGHIRYWAVSMDASTIIKWEETSTGEICVPGKKYYTRIPKEKILPHTANHDFLYE